MLKQFIFLCLVILICGCSSKIDDNFIQLDVPLKEALAKSTVIFENGNANILVGPNFQGTREYQIVTGETIKVWYHVYDEHVVETNRYIFTVIAYSDPGTAVPYYLIVIDKNTLTSIKTCDVLLDDSIIVEKLELIPEYEEAVSIQYLTRGYSASKADPPNIRIKRTYRMADDQLWIKCR